MAKERLRKVQELYENKRPVGPQIKF